MERTRESRIKKHAHVRVNFGGTFGTFGTNPYFMRFSAVVGNGTNVPSVPF